MSLDLLFPYLFLNMFRMLVHPSSGACDLCWNLHKDTTPPQPNHTVTPTHIEPEQYNTWDKSTISRKLPKMDVLTFETCWAVNSEIIKQVTSVGLSLFNYYYSLLEIDLSYEEDTKYSRAIPQSLIIPKKYLLTKLCTINSIDEHPLISFILLFKTVVEEN